MFCINKSLFENTDNHFFFSNIGLNDINLFMNIGEGNYYKDEEEMRQYFKKTFYRAFQDGLLEEVHNYAIYLTDYSKIRKIYYILKFAKNNIAENHFSLQCQSWMKEVEEYYPEISQTLSMEELFLEYFNDGRLFDIVSYIKKNNEYVCINEKGNIILTNKDSATTVKEILNMDNKIIEIAVQNSSGVIKNKLSRLLKFKYKYSYSKMDNVMEKLVDTINEDGIWSEGNVRTKYADGTPANYKSYIGYQFRINNSSDRAIIPTTRKCPLKDPIRELYWIWIMQSNSVDELKELGCKFWDEWKMEDGTIGPAYGSQIKTKTFGYESQLHYVVGELKKNPNSRRIMTEIWVPEDLDKMALTPCVHLTQWSVIGDKLYLEVRQRSCDVALGLVANVYQYAILHKLVAMECGLKPADIIWSIHNAHIYDRHMDDLLKQVKNIKYPAPKIEIKNFKSIFEFKPDDIVVIDYISGEKVTYEIAI